MGTLSERICGPKAEEGNFVISELFTPKKKAVVPGLGEVLVMENRNSKEISLLKTLWANGKADYENEKNEWEKRKRSFKHPNIVQVQSKVLRGKIEKKN